MDMRKAEALLKYVCEDSGKEYTLDDIEEEKYSESYTEYHTPIGTFTVLSDREADQAVVADIEALIDEMGLDAFSPQAQDYIENNCLDEATCYLEDIMRESFESYYNDIESEPSSYSFFENRLQEELFDMDDTVSPYPLTYVDNVIQVRYFHEDENMKLGRLLDDYGLDIDTYDEITEWFDSYEDNKEYLIDKAVDTKINEYDSAVDWVRNDFGEEAIKTYIKDGTIRFDYEAIAEYIIDEDGRGSSLSHWDGEEIELTNDFYAYKQDDGVYERDDIDYDDVERE